MPFKTEEQVTRFLASTQLLETLPKSELTALASQVRRLHVDAGQVIFNRSQSDPYIYWIARGRAKLTVNSSDGHELLHSVLEVGDHFGEISAIDGGTRGVNAVTYQKSIVLALERTHLMPAITSHPETAANVMRILCGQVRIAGVTLENLALHNAETRIWSRLMFLSERYARVLPEDGAIRIEHGHSQQELADSVGLTRVMVNRQMNLWRDAELVEHGRGFVVIKDREALEARVRGGSTRFALD